MMLRRTRHAFTLIELVAAMMVMVVVALIIGSAGAAFYNGYRRTSAAAEKLKERIAIDRVWDTTLSNMVPFKWKDENNDLRYTFSGKSDELWITSLRRVYGNDPNALLFLKLKVEDENLVATYSFYPMLPWDEEDQQTQTAKEIIAKNVAAVTFQYADKDDEDELEWLEEWEEEEHSDLPLAIRMTVEWKDGTKEYWLRRCCGVNYNSSFGNREAMTGYSGSGTTNSRNTTRSSR